MPAVTCRCGCGCLEALAYYGLGEEEPEDKGYPSNVCGNCLNGMHVQDTMEALEKQRVEDEIRTELKKHLDKLDENDKDDPHTILKRRLASGEITVHEYERIKERLDSE